MDVTVGENIDDGVLPTDDGGVAAVIDCCRVRTCCPLAKFLLGVDDTILVTTLAADIVKLFIPDDVAITSAFVTRNAVGLIGYNIKF